MILSVLCVIGSLNEFEDIKQYKIFVYANVLHYSTDSIYI